MKLSFPAHREMCHDDESHAAVGRHALEEQLDRLQSAGGSANSYDRKIVWGSHIASQEAILAATALRRTNIVESRYSKEGGRPVQLFPHQPIEAQAKFRDASF